jgi:hypothetical protein
MVLLLKISLMVLLALISMNSFPGDTRKVFGPNSPRWIEAVAVLHNEYVWQDKPDQLQQCTASLVAQEAGVDSAIIATAGHCVQGWINKRENEHGLLEYAYDAVQSPMTATFTRRDGRQLQRKVNEVLSEHYGDAGGADFAVLRLAKPVPASEIPPLVISELPFVANANQPFGLLEFDFRHLPSREEIRHAYLEIADLKPAAYAARMGRPKPFGTIAGYSADRNPLLGKGGSRLTYDDNCDFIYGHRGLDTTVWCTAYPGASGGPFVISLDRGRGMEHLMVGVLSGRRGIIPGQLRMIPVDTPAFRSALNSAFEKQPAPR